MKNASHLIARVLLAQLFVLSGLSKIGGFGGTQAYMEGKGMPGMLLPLVILLELGGGAAIILGYKTRTVALALGAFCIVAGLIFHGNFGDRGQVVHLMKNLSIAGGFLLLAIHGAGPLSLDNRKGT